MMYSSLTFGFAMGVLITPGLFFLSVYLYREKKNKSYLSLSLLCFAFFIYFITSRLNLSESIYYKNAIYISLPVLEIACVFFSTTLYKIRSRLLKYFNLLILTIGITTYILIYIFPLLHNLFFFIAALYPFILMGVLTINIFVKKKNINSTKIIIYSVFSIILLIGGLHSLLRIYNKLFYLPSETMVIAIVSVILIFSYLLMKILHQEYNQLLILQNKLHEEVDYATKKYKQQKENNKIMYVSFAHELKTTLSIIKILLEKINEKNFENLFQRIKKQILSLTKDVINFLDAAQIENNQEIYNHSDFVSFSAITKELCITQKEIVEKNKKITFRYKIEDNLVIRANINSVYRVVDNLISNAVKYTDNGLIQVEVIKENDNLKMSISDSGIGIKKENINKIFNFSYRGELAIQSCKKGYGMGLGMVKHIVESLHGNIFVESEENYKTIFIITIPLNYPPENIKILYSKVDQNDKEINIITRNEDTKSTKKKRKILIVDDNEELRFLLRNSLEKYYVVYSAKHGKEAIEILANNPDPDLIISDKMMPVMNGDDFFRATRKEYSHIPFLFFSAKSESEDISKSFDNGAIDYIEKPFSMHILVGKIKNLLDLSSRNKVSKINLEHISIIEIRKKVQKYSNFYKFTTQQSEIISLIIYGVNSNKEIANKINTSASNVGNQKNKIKSTLEEKISKSIDLERYSLAKIFNIV